MKRVRHERRTPSYSLFPSCSFRALQKIVALSRSKFYLSILPRPENPSSKLEGGKVCKHLEVASFKLQRNEVEEADLGVRPSPQTTSCLPSRQLTKPTSTPHPSHPSPLPTPTFQTWSKLSNLSRSSRPSFVPFTSLPPLPSLGSNSSRMLTVPPSSLPSFLQIDGDRPSIIDFCGSPLCFQFSRTSEEADLSPPSLFLPKGLLGEPELLLSPYIYLRVSTLRVPGLLLTLSTWFHTQVWTLQDDLSSLQQDGRSVRGRRLLQGRC